ncbi:MAG: hypothetical protein EOO12_00130 [Chitinophagaceae bacterium]|nr:MAG: hypothetical protein EOO12_00130 [Chitinophagaceae bacterium]
MSRRNRRFDATGLISDINHLNQMVVRDLLPTVYTYPPEMLPSPDEGEEAEVIVIHPDTLKAEVVAVITPADKP